MSTAYFYLTGEGEQLARKLAASHPGDLYDKENFKTNLQEAFHRYDYLVCIMATGIVVRILAPLLVHKTSDPGVVVLDQRGQYAISLLSGHLGGANDLAREMASLSGGEAVITTATDVAGELSFDTFSREYKITLIHQLRHTVTLGTDIFGNIQRLDNTLSAFEERMAACVEQLENTRVQLENAKAEVQKPFPQEEELKTKSARLNELNAMLNFDKRENEIVDGERGEEEPQKSSADRER